MRTPTKHSTNVDTAQPVVPVPTSVSRPPISATAPDTMLPTTIRNTSVRYFLNSPGTLSDSLISVQPQLQQFIFPSPSKINTKDPFPDRGLNSGTHIPRKHLDFDVKSGSCETTTTQISPITIITPTKTSPQIIPIMQARPNLQSASSVGNNVALPSVTFAQTNAKNIFPVATGALSAEASSSVTSNLIATLKPLKQDAMQSQTFTAVTINTADSASSSATLVSPMFKASSLVSHSTLPTVTVDNTQTPPLISVVSVDTAKSGSSVAPATATGPTITAIRSTQRIAVAPNRPVTTGAPLHRSPISRQSHVAPLSPHTSSTSGGGGPLTPSRKRARKQQLLAPMGSEPASVATAAVGSGGGTPTTVVNIMGMVSAAANDVMTHKTADLKGDTTSHQTTVPPTLPVATLTTVNSTTTGHVLNVRLLPRACPANVAEKEPLSSAYEHPSLTSPASLITPHLHSLVANSTSSNAIVTTGASEQLQQHQTNSIAASLVTASSFQIGAGQSQQQPFYMFPTSTNTATFRTVTAQSSVPSSTANSVGNVLQVRFRTPTPTPKKPTVSSTSSQQAIRTVLNQSLVNHSTPTVSTQPLSSLRVALPPASPPSVRKATSPPHVEWLSSKIVKAPAPLLPVTVKPSPVETSGQPTVPILRVADPISRNFYDSTQKSGASPSKRPRKQQSNHNSNNPSSVSNSNSGGIKKQCTWELRTDPMDSNRSIWRAPPEHVETLHQEGEQSKLLQPPSPPTSTLPQTQPSDPPLPHQQPTTAAAATSTRVHPSNIRAHLPVAETGTSVRELAEGLEWVIRGCPPRMLLNKNSSATRFSGVWKGSKTGHFLRSSEFRQRLDSVSNMNSAPPLLPCASTSVKHAVGGEISSSCLRRRRLHDQQHQDPPDVPTQNADLKTISDLLELRNQHDETEFINHPVHTTSIMDISGWRVAWCLRNFDDVVAAEYSKLELLAVVSEELQKRRVVGKLHSTCSNPVMDDRKAPPSMSSERPREDAGTDEEKQRQALLARLFLQAIPPASPANISSPTPNTLAQDPIVSSGRGAQIAADGEEVNRATHVHEDDAENVDELLQGLCQRVRTLIESLHRVSSLSRNLLLCHQEGVVTFIDDLEMRHREAQASCSDLDRLTATGRLSQPHSPHTRLPRLSLAHRNPYIHRNRHSDSDSDGAADRRDIVAATRRPKNRLKPGRGRSASPLAVRNTTSGRVIFPLGRRR